MKTYNVTLEIQGHIQVINVSAKSSSEASQKAFNLFKGNHTPTYIHKVRRDYTFPVTISIVSVICIALLVLAL